MYVYSLLSAIQSPSTNIMSWYILGAFIFCEKYNMKYLPFNKQRMSDKDGRNETNQVGEVFSIGFSTEIQPPGAVVGLEENDLEVPSDFEAAVDAAGYGLFNVLLFLALLPGGFSSFFSSTVMSYVLPSAECDLQLTLFHKGVLNAVAFIGMMSSAFLWGFFADTKGRRSLLQFGYLADLICTIMCSMSQSFYVLVIFKFLTGFIINGPHCIRMTYLAEFHGTKYRSRMLLWSSISPALANLTLPALAWAVIPQPWLLILFDGAFIYNSWRIFLLLCSIPSLLAFLTLFYFPESPRFLMSQGRNDEAMKVFRRMYSMNTGKAPETFPVKSLCQEVQKRQIERSASRRSMSVWDKTRNDLSQIKPLFQKPYVYQFLLVTTIQFGSLLGMNTLRLWMPQLFTMIENFDYENHDPSLGTPTLCDMISLPLSANATVKADSNSTIIDTCVVTPIHSRVYINSIILAVTSIIGHAIFGNMVNLVGKKILLLIAYAIPAVCSFLVNWSPTSDLTLAIFAIQMTLNGIAVSMNITTIVDLMPTTLRAMSVSMSLCIGRGGAVFGNLLFPILLNTGCMVPFIFVGGFLLVCFTLTIFIPKAPVKLM